MAVTLSQGKATLLSATKPTTVVNGSTLDPAAIKAVSDRLPAFTDEASAAAAFNWPVSSLPVPRAGTTIDRAFPPANSGPVPPAPGAVGPLKVLRAQPDGAVPIAPFVSITFNQDMVAIGTLDQVAAATVPATITPAVPGKWQWIGTRTLRFDASVSGIDRLPMSTDYRIDIPAGTRSASGGSLAQAVSFQFQTPTPTVQSFQPDNRPLALQQVFVVAFDQRIDPNAVLTTITMTAGGKARPLRLATTAEVAEDKTVYTSGLPDGRWLAFRSVDPLPADAAIEVAVGPGTASAEGPRTTTEPTTRSLRTYAPLRVSEQACTYGPECPPGSGLQIIFNNPLESSVDLSTITVDPPISGLAVHNYGNVVMVEGSTAAKTTYKIKLPADLTDVYGQRLGQSKPVTFTTGSAQPMIRPFQPPFTTLDPLASTSALTIATVNHPTVRVRIYAVEPSDWPSYKAWLFQAQTTPDGQLPDAPWKRLSATDLKTTGKADELSETSLDLSKALGGDRLGHLIVIVEPTTTYRTDDERYWMNRPTATWVQATHLGVDAIGDHNELRVWTTDLDNGKPVEGAVAKMLGADAGITSGADGWARLTNPAGSAVVVSKGNDTALQTSLDYDRWEPQQLQDVARWYVVDDRQTYRPGETVSIKGWLRTFATRTDAQLHVPATVSTVHYVAMDPRGVQIAEGDTNINRFGGFDLTVALPAGTNTGQAYVQLTAPGFGQFGADQFGHGFHVQEFRRPEFEVVAHSESAGPVVGTQPATVAVDATYFAGGPLAKAPVTWQVTTSTATYSPPGWDQFSFGKWTPSWGYAGDGFGSQSIGRNVSFPCCGPFGADSKVEEFKGTTDAAGHHFLQVDFSGADGALPDLPTSVVARANVEDVNRQQWASSANLVVHPAQLYVGLKSSRLFVKQGDPLDIQAIATDIDGKAVAGRALHITASRMAWKQQNGLWKEVSVDTSSCDTTSTQAPVTCSFKGLLGGTYTISSTITDDRGGRSRSDLTTWISGGDAKPTRNLAREELTLVPAKVTYAPGQSAEVLVQAPFASGHGMVTVSRVGILSTQNFDVANGSAVVQIPLADADIPNVDLFFEVVGATTRTGDDGRPLAGAPLRPAFAAGHLTVLVSTASRSLTVHAVPARAQLEPKASTQIDVSVADAGGSPVAGAEFAVVVVDEAVLALSDYKLTDPLALFYQPVTGYTVEVLGRDTIVLAHPDDVAVLQTAGGSATTAAAAATTAAPAGTTTMSPISASSRSSGVAEQAAPAAAFSKVADSAGGGRDGSGANGTGGGLIDTRTNFDALALFKPSTVTDTSGRATLAVTLPDNLTRYRIMVVAVAGDDRFGSTEAALTARLPLMVRPSAPRFANFGDTFDLPVVVQNQSDAPMTVDVVVQAANLTLTGPSGRRVQVPAQNRVEVRFPVSVAAVGTARIRVAAVSESAADAAIVSLPVYTPATAEAFATYGVIDGTSVIAQPVLAPSGVIPQVGGLNITTSSSALQGLTDAVLYLVQYPYVSADAAASRILSITALRGVLGAFNAPNLPSKETLDATVATDVTQLNTLQNTDGGFSYWQRDERSSPFVSIQAVHALALAQQGGAAVNADTLSRGLGYVRDIEAHFTSDMGESVRDALSAYALNIRALAGDKDATKAKSLWDRRGSAMSIEAAAWLWPVVTDATTDLAIERRIANSAVETAGAANFTDSYGDDAYVVLHSDRRVDGVVLDALIARRPDSSLIPKVVTGLLAHRTAGRWNNLQENTFILLALKQYFDKFENQTPAFVANVWLGERFAGSESFTDRSTDRVAINVPTEALLSTGNSTLTLSKEGAGRMYYRLGLTYAPANLQLDALDRGFVVNRTYEAIDNPAEVTRDAKGVWHVKAGARVRVKLTLVAESQRTHVALIDPLAAGLEIVNADLANAASPPLPEVQPNAMVKDGNGSGDAAVTSNVANGSPVGFWWGRWFDHKNTRDDRAEVFATLLPAGTYDYSYIAKATTPGSFVVPPSRAEEIYAPETFGRSGSATMVIEA